MKTAEQYQATFGTTENDTVSEIRSDYYGIGDHLLSLVAKLRAEVKNNPGNKALAHELKTFETMRATFINSDLGTIL